MVNESSMITDDETDDECSLITDVADNVKLKVKLNIYYFFN